MIGKSEKPAEIYWTPIDQPDVDFIPGYLTRVVRGGSELRLAFAGRDSRSGDEYEGVLTLQLIAGSQTSRGPQTYKEFGGEWEPLPFSVVGQFQDDRFTSFSGVWTEDGTRFQVDVVGLPTQSKSRPATTQSAKPRRRRKRVK